MNFPPHWCDVLFRIRRRQHRNIEHLYRAHGADLIYIFGGFGRWASWAEDLLHETFVQACENSGSSDPGGFAAGVAFRNRPACWAHRREKTSPRGFIDSLASASRRAASAD